MARSHSVAANSEITESLSTIEFDTESESFRATYDSTRDPTSLAVVAVVATVLNRAPRNLTPLQSVIETDSLDNLAAMSSSGRGNCVRISFRYEEFEITVFSEGTIEAEPMENG